MKRVLIRGDGIAAYCCEHLLSKAGFDVSIEAVDRPRLPAIMLSDAAVELIRDVFEQKDLFRNLHQIRKRVVAWGKDAKPVTLDHSAIVVSEQHLLESVRTEAWVNKAHADPEWTVTTCRPLPDGAVEHRFGSRMARTIPVTLRNDPGACWMESLKDGWLFLIPEGPRRGWLICVGAPSKELIQDSRVIAGQIEEVHEAAATGEFAAYPRTMSPLCGPQWVACGTAAIAFDPLCGDGTANAIREAILASALIQAISNGGSAPELFRHYEARLTAGFERHLALCLNFYQTGYDGSWWQQETAALRRGIDWCSERRGTFGAYRYQLKGFDLIPVLP